MDWQTVEMLGYTHYSQQGWRILVPLVNNAGYDFGIEKDGVFKRVNVKTASIKDPKRADSWSISVASGGDTKIDRAVSADIFLAYIHSCKKFVELPGDFFVGSRSKSRCVPVKLFR